MLIVNDEKLKVLPGQGMLLMPNEPHEYYPTSKQWRVNWVSFNGTQVETTLCSLQLKKSGVRYHTNPGITLQKMEEIISLLGTNHPRRTVDASSLVYSLLIDLYQWTSTSEIRSKKQSFEQMAPIFDFIEKNYHMPISLEQLSRQISVTAQHTCLLFQQTIGLRPFEYITRYRLRKAKEILLQQPTTPIKEIAAQVGYEHPSYFIKLFKKQEGVTPSKFREIYRKRSS